MIYLKSIMVGIVGLMFAAIIIYISAFLAILVIFRAEGVDLPIWHVNTKSIAFWLLVTVISGVGFLWEFKRLSK